MRAMRFFLGFAASSAFVGAIASGCGSSSSPSNPVDSGSGDVTTEAMPPMEAAVETGPDVVEAGPDVCVPDAMLSSIPVPDASLNDSGATAAGCVMCIAQTAACQPLVTECNQNCACIAAFQMFSECLGSPGGSLFSCGQSLLSLGSIGIDAGTAGCIASCAIACGYTLPSGGDGGKDGGGGEAGEEGGSEAGGD